MLPKRAKNMGSFQWSLLNYAVMFFLKMSGDQVACPFPFIQKVLQEYVWNWVKSKKTTLSKLYPDVIQIFAKAHFIQIFSRY